MPEESLRNPQMEIKHSIKCCICLSWSTEKTEPFRRGKGERGHPHAPRDAEQVFVSKQPETAQDPSHLELPLYYPGPVGCGPRFRAGTTATTQARCQAGCGSCLWVNSLLFASAVLPVNCSSLSFPCGLTYHPSMATCGYSSLKYVHLSKDLATKKHFRVFFGHVSKTIPKDWPGLSTSPPAACRGASLLEFVALRASETWTNHIGAVHWVPLIPTPRSIWLLPCFSFLFSDFSVSKPLASSFSGFTACVWSFELILILRFSSERY